MTWVDTHCHLQLDGREPSVLLDRASAVDWMVAPGVDAESSRASLALAGEFPGRVLPTAGLHPHEAASWPEQREAIEEMAPGVAAIGETGLDFYRDLSPRDQQEASFRGHIELALSQSKPIIVHCRDAFARIHDIIDETGVGGQTVLHSWTGGTRWTKRFLDLGVTFSFSGPLAFETGETIRFGAALVPPDRAVVETDTPYLAPPPHRGEQNEPAWVVFVGRALADVWGTPVEEVAAVTSANATRIFKP
ncbi:MAG: TatD family hydrolase [Acidobacteria bacterium]|nr:TatD family hydrolase [Acidobacteriota bacterium]TDI52692.1 MAG: TatD family deoxyribonuclease [Acidobacteriota bacterium]TDI53351.1 MAG: TatD family deoxyribonuclease [Acidobacteriota bacterium]TDI55671.1 MAG: TatD family deoxyribonuclease [Acidobacteriota bacterium]